MRCRIIIRAGAAIFPFFFHADQGRGGRVENEAETRGWRVFAKSFAQPLRETDGGGGRDGKGDDELRLVSAPSDIYIRGFSSFSPCYRVYFMPD